MDTGEDVGDIVAGHEGTSVVSWHLGESDGAGNGEDGHDGKNGPPQLDLVGDVDREQEDDDTDSTGRHLHEDGGELVESETLSDQTAEGTDTTRGAGSAEPHAGPHPSLGVLESLDDLGSLESGVFRTGVIVS